MLINNRTRKAVIAAILAVLMLSASAAAAVTLSASTSDVTVNPGDQTTSVTVEVTNTGNETGGAIVDFSEASSTSNESSSASDVTIAGVTGNDPTDSGLGSVVVRNGSNNDVTFASVDPSETVTATAVVNTTATPTDTDGDTGAIQAIVKQDEEGAGIVATAAVNVTVARTPGAETALTVTNTTTNTTLSDQQPSPSPTVEITPTRLPDGVRTYNLTVRVTNSSVAEIASVTAPAISPDTVKSKRLSPQAVRLTAVDFGGGTGEIAPGDTAQTLAAVTLTNTTPGTTTVTAEVNRFTDETANPLRSSTRITPGELRVRNTDPPVEPPVLTVTNATAQPGESQTTTAEIRATRLPTGIQEYELRVSLRNASVADFERVTPGVVSGQAFQIQSRSTAGGRVTFRATDLAQTLEPGATNRTLATVTYTDTTTGTTPIELAVTTLTDDQGTSVRPVVTDGRLTVEPITSPFPEGEELPGVGSGAGQAPTDPDDDGEFEDINGDGEKTFDDAIALAFANPSQLTEKQVEAVDFDGDGNVDFNDAIELAFQA